MIPKLSYVCSSAPSLHSERFHFFALSSISWRAQDRLLGRLCVPSLPRMGFCVSPRYEEYLSALE
jgi:hypothetical protein